MNSVEHLHQHVIDLEDYEVAADALSALQKRDSALAERLALDIITQKQGDPHFQAFAFDTLYAVNLQAGIALIRNPSPDLSATVLAAMIECVAEDVGIAQETPDILGAVDSLKVLINRLSPDEAKRIGETIAWFRQTYPDGKP